MMRPAVHEDVEALARVKGVYVRDLYRGFLPAEMLKQKEDSSFVPEMEQWLNQQAFRVDVLESRESIRGFIIYGADPDAEGCGLIRDTACDVTCDQQERKTMVEYSMRQMVSMGFSEVRLWILRDNFRARFLFESMGFRADGARRTQLVQDQELLISRYCYQVMDSHT